MTLVERIKQFIIAIVSDLGNTSLLTTKNKTNLVNAVNEVNTEIKSKVTDGGITNLTNYSDIVDASPNSGVALRSFDNVPMFYFKHEQLKFTDPATHDRLLLFRQNSWELYRIHPVNKGFTYITGQTPVINDDIESLTTTISSTKIKGLLTNLTSNSINTNSIKVGVNSPAIAYKVISGTTIPAQTNGVTRIAHGLNFRKILDWRVLLESTSGRLIEGNNDRNEEYYQVTVDATFFNLKYVGSIIATATEIENRPVKIFITYEV